MARSGKGAGKRSQLRIIGGLWRGRKLGFLPGEGLRPTTDRVRETLFNWLAAHVPGANCADLFAGSGALGLEALSRGASHCDFVDTSGAAVAQIETHLATLGAAGRATCNKGSALQYLQSGAGPWDIVFLDPPFGQGLADPACALLEGRRRLSARALVYLETAATEPAVQVPDSWTLHREKTAGSVCYRLFRTGPENGGP